MTASAYLLYQLAPIAAGAAFFVILRGLGLRKAKIRVEVPSGDDAVEGIDPGPGDARQIRLWNQTVTDLLIVRGRLPKRRTCSIRDYALKNAGIVPLGDIGALASLRTIQRPVGITLLAGEPQQLTRLMLTPCVASGLALAHELDRNLEVVSLWEL